MTVLVPVSVTLRTAAARAIGGDDAGTVAETATNASAATAAAADTLIIARPSLAWFVSLYDR
jgi:hypothetical protein